MQRKSFMRRICGLIGPHSRCRRVDAVSHRSHYDQIEGCLTPAACPTCRYCPLWPDGARSLILACQWLTLYVRGCASIWIGVFLGGGCENVCYKVHLMSSCHMWSQNASFALLSNTHLLSKCWHVFSFSSSLLLHTFYVFCFVLFERTQGLSTGTRSKEEESPSCAGDKK